MADPYRAGATVVWLAPGEVAGPTAFYAVSQPLLMQDRVDGGAHRVTEQVIYNNLPARRRVQLFRLEAQGVRGPIQETWSDPDTGVYLFEWLASGTYRAIADDYLLLKNSVIADRLTSEPMP